MHIFEILTMQICRLRETLRACKISRRSRDPRRKTEGGGAPPPPPMVSSASKSPMGLGLTHNHIKLDVKLLHVFLRYWTWNMILHYSFPKNSSANDALNIRKNTLLDGRGCRLVMGRGSCSWWRHVDAPIPIDATSCRTKTMDNGGCHPHTGMLDRPVTKRMMCSNVSFSSGLPCMCWLPPIDKKEMSYIFETWSAVNLWFNSANLQIVINIEWSYSDSLWYNLYNSNFFVDASKQV